MEKGVVNKQTFPRVNYQKPFVKPNLQNQAIAEPYGRVASKRDRLQITLARQAWQVTKAQFRTTRTMSIFPRRKSGNGVSNIRHLRSEARKVWLIAERILYATDGNGAVNQVEK